MRKQKLAQYFRLNYISNISIRCRDVYIIRKAGNKMTVDKGN